MATENNKQHINSFTKGMNSDTSYDMLESNQYTYGENIRITNNTNIGVPSTSNSTEGIVSPLPEGLPFDIKSLPFPEEQQPGNLSILGFKSLGNIGALVVLYKDDNTSKWAVFKLEIADDGITPSFVFSTKKENDRDKFSLLLNKETENVLNLYIADGENPVMSINLMNPEYYNSITDINYLMTNRYFPTNKVWIDKIIDGTLTTGQVLYTYRLYHKNGVRTRLAPLTNKILVIDKYRNKEIGNAADTQTSIGFQLRVPLESGINEIYDYIQLYRITYKKPHTDPDVLLILDTLLQSGDEFIINDTGLQSLLDLSVEEFASLDTLDITPQYIELNQGYLFAANIKDETNELLDVEFESRAYSFNTEFRTTLYKNSNTTYDDSLPGGKIVDSLMDDPGLLSIENLYDLNKGSDLNNSSGEYRFTEYNESNIAVYGGYGANINWKLVCVLVPLDDDVYSKNVPESKYNFLDLTVYYIKSNNLFLSSDKTIVDIIQDQNVKIDLSLGYNDIVSSSLLRSLKRDEVYRYGIVLYDKYGHRSDVKWIADIKTPSAIEVPLTDVVSHEEEITYTVPASIVITVLGSELEKTYSRKPSGDDIFEDISYKCWTNDEDSSPYNIVYTSSETPEKYDEVKYINSRFQTYGSVESYQASSQETKTITITSEYANVLGIEFNVTLPEHCKGYQIVRCEKNDQYTKNLLLCCTSRPVVQELYSTGQIKKLSPYYPQFLINNSNIEILTTPWTQILDTTNTGKNEIFLIFCPEFYYQQLSYDTKLNNNIIKLNPICFKYEYSDEDEESNIGYDLLSLNNYMSVGFNLHPFSYVTNTVRLLKEFTSGAYYKMKNLIGLQYSDFSDKTQRNYIFKINKIHNFEGIGLDASDVNIKNIANVQNPSWEQGFGNIQISGDQIVAGTKLYKSYVTSIGDTQYNNWISNAMYDLAISNSIDEPGLRTGAINRVFVEGDDYRLYSAAGWIGPGPRCFVVKIEPIENSVYSYGIPLTINNNLYLYTIISNITHSASQFAGLSKQEKQYDIYYGFGNFSTESTKFVFDGDTYIVPCEITSIYKTYDFNSRDSLPSTQIVNYVTMESSINTYFDYGMSYRNTQSKNLMLEPGEITGVVTQERPEHQYNDIYSDNNISCDIFNAQSLEDTVDTYPQRIFYSQHKLNGERIDSWLDFKAIDYIDVDTRYDAITNLLQSKNILYFWLNSAFGKLSVNERSLITDESNNKISLGEGGVLQRSDYIDTKYGMRKDDFSALGVGPGVYWIDIMNKAIVMSDGNNVVNYGERVNVLNIINSDMSANIPQISYDLQNDELICKCLNNDKQLVFNLKLNVATSVYTREYLEMLLFNNVLYGLTLNGLLINLTQYNYIRDAISYLNTVLSFVVNPGSSETKVYDNQQIVTLYRKDSVREETDTYWHNKKLRFETDILKEEDTINYSIDCTEREGNIRYAIPRYGNENFGNRWRGKWLKVLINADYQSDENYNPYEDSISHIITSYRKSFS